MGQQHQGVSIEHLVVHHCRRCCCGISGICLIRLGLAVIFSSWDRSSRRSSNTLQFLHLMGSWCHHLLRCLAAKHRLLKAQHFPPKKKKKKLFSESNETPAHAVRKLRTNNNKG